MMFIQGSKITKKMYSYSFSNERMIDSTFLTDSKKKQRIELKIYKVQNHYIKI
jgi:hypothetical protein